MPDQGQWNKRGKQPPNPPPAPAAQAAPPAPPPGSGMHADLDGAVRGDADLLCFLLDDAKAEIRMLRQRLANQGGPLRFCGPGRLPTRTYDDDAGLDLYVEGNWWIPAGEFVDIDNGVSVELPDGYWGLIVGRSSTLRKRGLLVNMGIIDTGYRGPLYSGVWNLSGSTVRVADGQRIAQLIVMPNTTQHWIPTDAERLSASPRGERGFGSSGA